MYQRILVPVDGSSTSNAGLEEAIKLAKLTGGTLGLLHVVELVTYATGYAPYAAFMEDLIPALREAGQQVLDQALAQTKASAVAAEAVLVEKLGGRVSDAILEQANSWQAELIVIGTHGRRGIGRMLMGSDAEQVLRLAPVPVLLVRATGAAAG